MITIDFYQKNPSRYKREESSLEPPAPTNQPYHPLVALLSIVYGHKIKPY